MSHIAKSRSRIPRRGLALANLRGTVFTASGGQPREPAGTKEGPLATQHVVLVVEDEEAIRRLVQETLADEGYEVLLAADAPEAFEVLQGRAVSLILLDLLLASTDGEAFAASYLERTEDPAPIVLLTAREDEGQRPPGVVGYLQKPFDLDDLLQVVDEHARSRSPE